MFGSNEESVGDLIVLGGEFVARASSSELVKKLNGEENSCFQEMIHLLYCVPKFIDFCDIFLSEKNKEEDVRNLDDDI